MTIHSPLSRLRAWPAVALLLGVASAGAGEVTLPGYALLDEEAGEYSLVCRLSAPNGWTAKDEARIAFDVRGAGEFAYVRVGGGRAALVAVAGGREQLVGAAKAFQPPPSCFACLQRRERAVRFVADGRVLLDVEWPRPLGGRAGTAAAGNVQVADTLLQPYAPPLLRDDFTRDSGELGGWEARSGGWQNTMIAAPRAEAARSANPFTIRATAAPDALLAGGDWFWDTYQAAVSVKPLGATEVGLCAYVQADGSRLQLTWKAGAPDAPHARQLLLFRGGKATVLADGPGGCVEGQWYRLELRVRPGRVEALIDRDPALAAATDAFGQGGIGLWCASGEAVFDDATALGKVTAPEPPRPNPTFVADETMGGNLLYLPMGQWRPAEAGCCWSWGEYFEDVALTLPAGALSAEPVTVLLRAPTADAAGAAAACAVSLRRNGEAVEIGLKTPSGKTAAATCRAGARDLLTLGATASSVTVRSGEATALLFTEAALPAGRKLGLTGAFTGLINTATISSSHLHDEAFDSAPTDWFAGKGLWQVTTRWPCQPGWTFFGGTHDENPVLWTKHRYEGDMALEFFANVPMDCAPPPGYSRPSDLDAELCGDGVDLGSGYSFIFAGWRNTRTAILRRGQIVAQTGDAVFVNPTSTNFAFHRHWFRVRAERLGNRVALSVDGKPVLQYDDPQPLPGGRAALFSFHNGLMVGRVRLWFERELPGGVVPPRGGAPAPAPQPRAPQAAVSNDFEDGIGEWRTFDSPPTVELALDGATNAGGRRSLRLTTLVSGGSFGAYAVTTPFRATDCPRLSFDYRLPPGVQANLYLYLNDRWHAIALSAEEPSSTTTPLLGRLEDIRADDRWHRASFDLLTPLQLLYPQLKAFTVKYVAFSAPEESYVRCGIGGNERGARFWVDNFRIGPRT